MRKASIRSAGATKHCSCGSDAIVTQAAERRQTQIGALLKAPSITTWERSFLQSIARQRHLTEKQAGVLAKIHIRIRP